MKVYNAYTKGRSRPRPSLMENYGYNGGSRPVAPMRVWQFGRAFNGWVWMCRLECWAADVMDNSNATAQDAWGRALAHLDYWHAASNYKPCGDWGCKFPHLQWGLDPAGLVKGWIVPRGHVISWASLTPEQATQRHIRKIEMADRAAHRG